MMHKYNALVVGLNVLWKLIETRLNLFSGYSLIEQKIAIDTLNGELIMNTRFHMNNQTNRHLRPILLTLFNFNPNLNK